MRRVIMAAVSTVAALILLLSFKTHSATSLATPPAAVASTVPSAASTAAASASAAAPASASAAAPAATTTTTTSTNTPATKTPATKTPAATKKVTGDAIDTRYGPVQVEITVTNGKLTAVQAVDYPQQERRDQEINSYAIPVLDKEALAAGSAKIDVVSGATYTSDGYANSLQSALDKAGL